MVGRKPEEVKTMICKGCGRKVMRYTRFDDYCRKPECQRKAAAANNVEERKISKRGRRPIEFDEVKDFGIGAW